MGSLLEEKAVYYSPVFQGKDMEFFLPYEELMFECKSHAKIAGRAASMSVYGYSGAKFLGKIIRLHSGDDATKYPVVAMNADAEKRKEFLALCGGSIYKKFISGGIINEHEADGVPVVREDARSESAVPCVSGLQQDDTDSGSGGGLQEDSSGEGGDV